MLLHDVQIQNISTHPSIRGSVLLLSLKLPKPRLNGELDVVLRLLQKRQAATALRLAVFPDRFSVSRDTGDLEARSFRNANDGRRICRRG